MISEIDVRATELDAAKTARNEAHKLFIAKAVDVATCADSDVNKRVAELRILFKTRTKFQDKETHLLAEIRENPAAIPDDAVPATEGERLVQLAERRRKGMEIRAREDEKAAANAARRGLRRMATERKEDESIE